MSLNNLELMRINQLNVESVEEAKDFFSREKITIINYLYDGVLDKELKDFESKIQIDIPMKNVRLVIINKPTSSIFLTSINTAAFVKSKNPHLYVILALSLKNCITKHDSDSSIKIITDDLIDELSIIEYDKYTFHMQLVLRILNKNPKLRKFGIPKDISKYDYE
jgi:hypothetical protein